ncbi:hypothetical protein [Mangrovibacterium lignilyticum]|uniref:hypothetical protein n=1 Tax=Mangrovibacterium lignilyticum TaxID=2668052 RepID=UPI0013D10AFF|nr:hypothetical protein [Mangrovibacterium lignilyticum]
MKKLMKLLPAFLALATLLVSCSDDDNDELDSSELVKGAYVVNAGFYSNDAASITKYDDEGNVTEYYDQLQNNGAVMTSAPQDVYELDDKVYVAGNEPDRVVVYNSLWQGQDTITTNVVRPRCFASQGDYLYVSCWGENPDWTDMPDTYILKYNMVTGTSEKISLPGGPEGLAIANGKLYAALNYSHQIAVMNLSTEEFSYIATEAVSSSVVKDANDNVYVALLSSYSDVSTEIGLGVIDTNTDELSLYKLDAVSSNSASIVAVSKDNSKVYVVAAGYDANWNMVGGIQVFDTATKTFEETPLISNVTGINAVSVDPENGDVYVLISTGGLTKGEMNVYSADHTLKAEETVGANPSEVIFLD